MHRQDNNIPGLKFRLGQICQKPRPAAFNQIGNATGRWVISPDDVIYSEADRLGGGHFGEVYRGKFRGTFDVAIKTLKCDGDPAKSQNARDEFDKETKILMRLHHPNLVQVISSADLHNFQGLKRFIFRCLESATNGVRF